MSTALQVLKTLETANRKDPNWINKDLYRILYKPDIFVLAYEKIKSKEGNMTRGFNNETLDGISTDWINRTIQDLRNWGSFKFTPGRRVRIPKANGSLRTLVIAPPREKVIQEAIRLILEAIYDSQEKGSLFEDSSHGFRKNKSCHTALKDIKNTWNGTKWFIEGDITGFFDNMDHHILIDTIKNKIKDEKFIELLWKFLRAGYNEGNTTHKVASLTGTPQGGILSPILSNIYLDSLDKYAKNLSIKYNNGNRRRANNAYNKVSRKMTEANNPQEIKELYKLRRTIQSRDPLYPNYCRIRYVRYADDWIIGVTGSRALAEEIKLKISNFLEQKLKLTLNQDKTFIRHAKSERATFLGIEISTSMNRNNHSILKQGKKVKYPSDNILMNVNMEKIVKRLNEAKICDKKGFPIGRTTHINYEDWEIISLANSVLLGISNYYSFVNNRYKLSRIQYIIQFSTAKTLARKHQMSMRQIFKKFGNNLHIVSEKQVKIKEVSLRTDLNWKNNPQDFKVKKGNNNPELTTYLKGLLNHRKITKSNLGKPCAICGSFEKVEMHHLKHIRKSGVKYGGFDKYMGILNRKQLPLCKFHHQEVHRGHYDGVNLRDKENIVLNNSKKQFGYK